MNRDKYRKLSQQQAEANRRNGLTHGLSGDKYFILEGEDPEAFLRLLQDLHDHPSPVGDGEDLVVQRIAAAQWRLDLCISMGEKESSPADPHDPDDLLARAFMLQAARSAQCPAVPEAPHAPEAPAPEPPNPPLTPADSMNYKPNPDPAGFPQSSPTPPEPVIRQAPPTTTMEGGLFSPQPALQPA